MNHFPYIPDLTLFAVFYTTYGAYSRPYIDFGVSKIYDGYFYVIGELKV